MKRRSLPGDLRFKVYRRPSLLALFWRFGMEAARTYKEQVEFDR